MSISARRANRERMIQSPNRHHASSHASHEKKAVKKSRIIVGLFFSSNHMFLRNRYFAIVLIYCCLVYSAINLDAVGAWPSKFIIMTPESSLSTQLTTTAVLATSSWTGISEMKGRFDAKSFAATNCWGQQPVLLRGSFDTEPLPSWDDVCQLAADHEYSEEEGIASRLITHEPGALDTFRLHFGPFSQTEMLNYTDDGTKKREDTDVTTPQVSTLVVNDVDRWIPSLSDWMDAQFGFLPRWRRDDAQVSLARIGGGIGPHVDNYDVFLIQASGTRTWKVGLDTLSTEDEFDNLVEASEVRVLDLGKGADCDFITLTVEPGDCLYLPPRVIHWGSATSDDCMTLSVGCRAPSASELLQRVTESISGIIATSPLATARYTDTEDIDEWTKSCGNQRDVSDKVKEKMKRLVLDLVEQHLEDNGVWDKLVGELITEPNRPMIDYPTPISEMDEEWKAELGVWANSETALQSVLEGNGVLRRAEGVAFAWSASKGTEKEGLSLFAQGRTFPLKECSSSASNLLDTIANGAALSQQQLVDRNIKLSTSMKALLVDLLEEGLLYGDHDEE